MNVNNATKRTQHTPYFFDCNFLKKAGNIADIIITEAYATLKYTLPASLKWVWRKYITQEIKTISIQVTVEKVTKFVYLNIHGNLSKIKENDASPSVLLSHGDHGHPYVLLHLADIAQKKGKPTFSLYIPGVANNKLLDIHNDLLGLAIDKIEKIVGNHKKKFAGIVGVGHSKGAILLAHRQFVKIDSRIKATCSIAGRLNAPKEKDCPDQTLKNIVRTIYKGISENPQKPIMQIVPKNDWNASYKSMAIRPQNHCHTVPGMHLSAIYTRETESHFVDFLDEFASKSILF